MSTYLSGDEITHKLIKIKIKHNGFLNGGMHARQMTMVEIEQV